jgi:hypothetical protein
MARSEIWLKRWKQLADDCDADAQIVLAWEHVKDKIVEKDFNRAGGKNGKAGRPPYEGVL